MGTTEKEDARKNSQDEDNLEEITRRLQAKTRGTISHAEVIKAHEINHFK